MARFGLRAKIDARAVSNALARSPRIFLRELTIGAKQGLTVIQEDARRNHRFITRSGNLERSVQVDNPILFQKIGRVFLDIGIALYGSRIHRGFGTWRMDLFLFEAAKKKTAEVINLINRAIGKAIIKAGLK